MTTRNPPGAVLILMHGGHLQSTLKARRAGGFNRFRYLHIARVSGIARRGGASLRLRSPTDRRKTRPASVLDRGREPVAAPPEDALDHYRQQAHFPEQSGLGYIIGPPLRKLSIKKLPATAGPAGNPGLADADGAGETVCRSRLCSRSHRARHSGWACRWGTVGGGSVCRGAGELDSPRPRHCAGWRRI